MTAAPAPPARASVCALLTCYNRREKTVACLQALQANRAQAGVDLHAVLVDDGSGDGTAACVREQFPWVEVIESSGELYWCRGMHLAFAQALRAAHDHYLWLNDDTALQPDALARLLACHDELSAARRAPLIVVGSCRDSGSGALTYGGVRRATRWVPTRFVQLLPSNQPVPLDTFDGNVVLVSAAAAALVGNLDPAFEHAMGDYDYGLRARRLGVEAWLAPGWHGVCDGNSLVGTYLDPALPWPRRWKLMLGRKGLPPRSWWRFNRQHAGPLWLAAFLWPYVRVTTQSFLMRPLRGRA